MSDRLSIVVTLNPINANLMPDIRFLGCQTQVEEYRELLATNIKVNTHSWNYSTQLFCFTNCNLFLLQELMWDTELDILYNLSNLLDFTFPTKPEEEEEEYTNSDLVQPGECAICLMIKLDDEIPTHICDNQLCMSQYHAVCLFRYLKSVPTNIETFGRIQGECPNCDHVISCPIVMLHK